MGPRLYQGINVNNLRKMIKKDVGNIKVYNVQYALHIWVVKVLFVNWIVVMNFI